MYKSLHIMMIFCSICLPVSIPAEESLNSRWVSIAIEQENFELAEYGVKQALRGETGILPEPESLDLVLLHFARIQLEYGLFLNRSGTDRETVLEILDSAEQSVYLSLEQGASSTAEAWLYLGWIKMKYAEVIGSLKALKKITEARDSLVKSLEFSSDLETAWGYLGDIYGNMPPYITFGNLHEAISFSRRALFLNEGNSVYPLLRLIRFLYRRDWSIRKRVKARARGIRIWQTSGEFLEKNGSFEFSDISTEWFYDRFGITFPDCSDREEAEQLLIFLKNKAEEEDLRNTDGELYEEISSLLLPRHDSTD